MELTNAGLTGWYATPDAPAPPQQVSDDSEICLTVGVRPAHPSNGVDVMFRENGGAERLIRGTLSHTDYETSQQLFRAEFPPLSPGTRVEYAPVVRQGGRRIDFRQSGQYPSSFFVAKSEKKPQAPDASSGPLTLHPYHLEHITRADLTLVKNAEVIGETPEGIRLNFQVSGGSYSGKICGRSCGISGDWLNVRPDGIGILDTKITINTGDGATLLLIGSGTVDLGRDGYRSVAAGRYPDRAPIVEVMRFLASDPKYAWLLRLQCMAIGYATTEKVCYDVYGVHSLCT
jgi:hypothetical protein